MAPRVGPASEDAFAATAHVSSWHRPTGRRRTVIVSGSRPPDPPVGTEAQRRLLSAKQQFIGVKLTEFT
jgi:hypothetical protein